MLYPVSCYGINSIGKWGKNIEGVVLADEDTLREIDVKPNEFIELCMKGKIGGNFGDGLVLSRGYKLEDLQELSKTRKVCLISGRYSIDINITDETISYVMSSHKKSWRAHKMYYDKNGVFVYSNVDETCIWYDGLLYTIEDLNMAYGMYFTDDDELCFVYEDCYGNEQGIYLEDEMFMDTLYTYSRECSLSEAKRRAVL